MAIQRMDANLIKIGPCWVSYKGIQLGSTQGGVTVKNENTSHEVKVDQTGEEILAEILLGGAWSAEVPLVEINKGVMGAIAPGADIIEEDSPFVAADSGSVYAGGKITFSVPITGIRVGDVVTYLSGGSSVKGTVGQFDLLAKEVYLKDGDSTPDASPNASLTHVSSVKFHNATGVNLLTLAGELILVPKDPNDTDYIIMPKAGLVFQPEFGFMNEEERKWTLQFKGYPDNDILHPTYSTGMGLFFGKQSDYDELSGGGS